MFGHYLYCFFLGVGTFTLAFGTLLILALAGAGLGLVLEWIFLRVSEYGINWPRWLGKCCLYALLLGVGVFVVFTIVLAITLIGCDVGKQLGWIHVC